MAMASIRKIALRAKVSTATVSRVLNGSADISEETRKKVLTAARASNYVGAVGRRVMTNVGLVFAATTEFCPFDQILMSGILRGLEEQKFDVTIVNLERDKRPGENYTQFFMRKGLRGVLVRSPLRSRSVCEAIAAEGFPQVVIAERFDDPAVNYIATASGEGTRRAVEHLIQLGHRRIAFAMHHELDSDHAERLEGFEQAMAATGLTIEENMVIRLVADFQGGVSALNELMSLPRPPSAIFFADPMPAIGAIRRANYVGLRVPEDLSIIAVDDSRVRMDVFPPMTAVIQSVVNLGFEAALWLTRRLVHNVKEPLRQVLPARFEVNGTTAAAPERVIRVLPDGSRLACEE